MPSGRGARGGAVIAGRGGGGRGSRSAPDAAGSAMARTRARARAAGRRPSCPAGAGPRAAGSGVRAPMPSGRGREPAGLPSAVVGQEPSLSTAGGGGRARADTRAPSTVRTDRRGRGPRAEPSEGRGLGDPHMASSPSRRPGGHWPVPARSGTTANAEGLAVPAGRLRQGYDPLPRGRGASCGSPDRRPWWPPSAPPGPGGGPGARCSPLRCGRAASWGVRAGAPGGRTRTAGCRAAARVPGAPSRRGRRRFRLPRPGGGARRVAPVVPIAPFPAVSGGAGGGRSGRG